jgi:large subunit ribosomal protein L4
MQLDVLNIEGKKTGRKVELPDEIFGIEPNDHVIYLAVKQYLAAHHQGTHNVKDRSDVKGSSRKLHRQKGTGGSRKGNIRNPLYRGGGSIFGPKPHSYDLKVNRKEKDLAKMSALSHKASGEAIRVVEDPKLESPKTKQFADILKSLEVTGKKVLFVTPEYEDKLYRSLRNLPSVKGTVLSDLNTYDIVNSHFLVFTEEAVKVFEGDGAAKQPEAEAAAKAKPAATKTKKKSAEKPAEEAGSQDA